MCAHCPSDALQDIPNWLVNNQWQVFHDLAMLQLCAAVNHSAVQLHHKACIIRARDRSILAASVGSTGDGTICEVQAA